MVVSCKQISTKTGKNMAFVMLEDCYKNRVEVVVFSGLFVKVSDLLIEGGFLLVSGILEKSADIFKLKADKVLKKEDILNTKVSGFGLQIFLKSDLILTEPVVRHFSEYFEDGFTQIRLNYLENEKVLRLIPDKMFDFNHKLLTNFLSETSLVQKIDVYVQ